MKKMRYLQSVLQFLFTVLVSPVIAQNFASVDSAVKQFGGMSDKNVATIAQTITLAFPEKISKARAIYYWIAKNIALDPKASRSNDQKNSDPVKVIELRKATPLGFSLLFQEMCSQAGIR
ncbi:MAG: transglutaminase domain-containing protein, partial [Ferruginibacter sp.]|nr:transglutaminase domain-containing protein [Ferruginibacter sp.]